MEHLSRAYILHRRLFRDSSFIVLFFTADQGIIAAVAKGARNPKSKLHGMLQFFSPLLISCYGKSELLGLMSAELDGRINMLSGKYLLSMLYVNELLCKLLLKFEAHPVIFTVYQQLIEQFVQQQPIEPALRVFEMKLLQELGYGLNFSEILMDQNYSFSLEDGIQIAAGNSAQIYSGKVLQQIQQQQFNDKTVLTAAKQLFRQIFAALLQHKTINSRQLFNYTEMVE